MKKNKRATSWPLVILVTMIVLVVGAFLYLGIFAPLIKRGGEAASVCKGTCSNKIIEIYDDKTKQFTGYEDMRACSEVNRRLKEEAYVRDTYGQCEGGNECCVGFRS